LTSDHVLEFTLPSDGDLYGAQVTSNIYAYGTSLLYAGLWFKPDGTKFYVSCTSSGNIWVRQYGLSTAWDLTSTVTQDYQLAVTGIDKPYDIMFNSAGTKMMVHDSISDDMNEYTLSTAWVLSSATLTDTQFVSDAHGRGYGAWFNSDGKKLYVRGLDFIRFDLTTGYDLSTKGASTRLYDTNDYLGYPLNNGQDSQATEMHTSIKSGYAAIVDDSSRNVSWEITRDTADDRETASFMPAGKFRDRVAFAPKGGDSSGGFWFKLPSMSISEDGTKLVCMDAGESFNMVHAAGTMTSGWDLSTFSASLTNFWDHWDQGDYSAGGYVRPDGLKLFFLLDSVGYTKNRVAIERMSMSVAWDLTTLTYDDNYLTGTGITGNGGTESVTFKPDGTRLYISSSSTIYQYDLSTAWDLTTAGTASSWAGHDGGYHINWTPNGRFAIVDGWIGFSVHGMQVYRASTPWDVTTLGSRVALHGVDTAPYAWTGNTDEEYAGLVWHPTGKSMIVVRAGYNALEKWRT
jgi:DNA-binding beta-propeller fold protein YncE